MCWCQSADFYIYGCPDCGGRMDMVFDKKRRFYCASCDKRFATYVLPPLPPLPEIPDPYEVTYG